MTPERGRYRELTQGDEGVAANLYQGIRSEYLAQYVFSMFGTVTRVPNEEDHGMDLSCTITRRAGGRAEPYAYYLVQVKSAPEDWIFGGPWLGEMDPGVPGAASFMCCGEEGGAVHYLPADGEVPGRAQAGAAAEPDAGSW